MQKNLVTWALNSILDYDLNYHFCNDMYSTQTLNDQ